MTSALARASIWLGSDLDVADSPKVTLLEAPEGSDAAPNAAQLRGLKDELVTAVSHELRTPLSILVGGLELLLDEDLGELNDAQRRLLERMWVNAARLGALADNTRSISDHGRASAREVPEVPESTDLMRGIEHAVASHHFGDREIIQRLPGRHPLLVAMAEADFEMALERLLDNAIKFREDGTDITISVEEDGDHWLLSVFDNGVGVEAKELVHITSPFFRTASARRAETQGAGLGLSVVKVLVESSGGSLGIASKPGVGTRVSLRLPMASESP